MNKSDENKKEILEQFLDKLITNQKDIPEDFREIANKHFWDLLY